MCVESGKAFDELLFNHIFNSKQEQTKEESKNELSIRNHKEIGWWYIIVKTTRRKIRAK